MICNAGSASFEHVEKISQALWGHFTPRNHEFCGLFDTPSVCAAMLKIQSKFDNFGAFLFDLAKVGYSKSGEMLILKNNFLNIDQHANFGRFRLWAHFIMFFLLLND